MLARPFFYVNHAETDLQFLVVRLGLTMGDLGSSLSAVELAAQLAEITRHGHDKFLTWNEQTTIIGRNQEITSIIEVIHCDCVDDDLSVSVQQCACAEHCVSSSGREKWASASLYN